MRGFIRLTEDFGDDFENDENGDIAEDVTVPDPSSVLLEKLVDLAEKLRSHTEDGVGEMPLGVELGMQRAADMIDNIISEFQKD